METHLDLIWKVLLWGFGSCITGFLFLAGWLWTIMQTVSEYKSHKITMEEVNEKLDNILNALVGTLDKRGLIPKIDDMEDAIKNIKYNCDKIQDEKKKNASAH